MAKRRIVLSSQEMNDITGKIKLLESQLSRSNSRVSELEAGVRKIKKLVNTKSKQKNPDTLFEELDELSTKTINPPVKVREERLAAELEAEAS
jgi:predicted  nucleic acid-binding Zn-ribbon protein